ncbi:hypothetical protein UUU_18460 [Klebsiella pneumoniae subsp. pneumoniae DSM 30104 = JCM 1662 = NBRC 14940]|nr:hypothetical protein UUU_18460 [Klebsiella pneumoniae subsp. pneumoniae DSM 30104 = JCM 1662 = NBRC 14940]
MSDLVVTLYFFYLTLPKSLSLSLPLSISVASSIRMKRPESSISANI